MENINKIIGLIDAYLEKKHMIEAEANEIARFLDRQGVLNYSTKGQPFRKLLREGKIPNAEQPAGKNTSWYIRHSKGAAILCKPNNISSLPTSSIKGISFDGVTKGLSDVSNANSEILILGTLPGKKSLEKEEYYINPKNKFWEILSIIYRDPVPKTYKDRIVWLKKHRIALWDVLKFADRDGSLDKDIRNPISNDIANFISSHPYLRIIVLNGTSDTQKYFNTYVDVNKIPNRIKILPLPSTSSSNTHFTFEEKVNLWRGIL